MTAAPIRIEEASPTDPDYLRLTRALDEELHTLYPIESVYSVAPDKLAAPGCCLLLARSEDGRVVGCGALRKLGPTLAEIKRMYVDPDLRGHRLGRRILDQLEARARAFGYRRLRLETGTLQERAVNLYVSAGFTRIPCYNEYADDPHSLCFEKRLTTASGGAEQAPGSTRQAG